MGVEEVVGGGGAGDGGPRHEGCVVDGEFVGEDGGAAVHGCGEGGVVHMQLCLRRFRQIEYRYTYRLIWHRRQHITHNISLNTAHAILRSHVKLIRFRSIRRRKASNHMLPQRW